MDAPATVVATTDMTVTSTDDAFIVACPEPNPRWRYQVRALVDLDGDGQLGRGDWMTVQSYPVMTFGNGDNVDLELDELEA